VLIKNKNHTFCSQYFYFLNLFLKLGTSQQNFIVTLCDLESVIWMEVIGMFYSCSLEYLLSAITVNRITYMATSLRTASHRPISHVHMYL